MSLTSAQQFVGRMKQDAEFRNAVKNQPTEKALQNYLKSQGFEFDQLALVGAMAECMTELDIMMKSMKTPLR